LTVLKALYQSQTDAAISSKYGIGSEDKADFYQWCKTNHKAAMQDAVMKQLHSNEVSGWKPLTVEPVLGSRLVNPFLKVMLAVSAHALTPYALSIARLRSGDGIEGATIVTA
jgi:hypothetical protein